MIPELPVSPSHLWVGSAAEFVMQQLRRSRLEESLDDYADIIGVQDPVTICVVKPARGTFVGSD